MLAAAREVFGNEFSYKRALQELGLEQDRELDDSNPQPKGGTRWKGTEEETRTFKKDTSKRAICVLLDLALGPENHRSQASARGWG